MKSVMVTLDSIEKVKGLVTALSPVDCDFDLVSERYVVDAKSIMGIFSLDLSKKLQLNIHKDEAADDIIAKIKEYIVE